MTVTCTTDTQTVGGSVSGATGSVTVLNNGGDAQVIPSNGSFTFSTQNDGTGYLVTVSSSPATQTCLVANGTGTLAGNNISNVTVTCTTNTYTISGSVFGASGSVTILNNGGDAQVIPSNGPFSFPPQDDGTSYDVTVSDYPVTQTCSVLSGSGVLNGANEPAVAVICGDTFSTAVADDLTVIEDTNANS